MSKIANLIGHLFACMLIYGFGGDERYVLGMVVGGLCVLLAQFTIDYMEHRHFFEGTTHDPIRPRP